MDKYALISFVPSVAIVAFSIAFVFVGVAFVKKNMAQDAEAAKQKGE